MEPLKDFFIIRLSKHFVFAKKSYIAVVGSWK